MGAERCEREDNWIKNRHRNMTKPLLVLLCGYLMATIAGGQTRDSFTVYLFLLEDCKITQAYTAQLDSIYAQYASDSITFVGLFPNPLSNDSTVWDFQEKYALPFPCTTQGGPEAARRFGATVTPEVVLYNETRQHTLYQGRIDNLYEKLGQRRRVVTSFELRAALEAVREHRPVAVRRTRPTGCFIPRL